MFIFLHNIVPLSLYQDQMQKQKYIKSVFLKFRVFLPKLNFCSSNTKIIIFNYRTVLLAKTASTHTCTYNGEPKKAKELSKTTIN